MLPYLMPRRPPQLNRRRAPRTRVPNHTQDRTKLHCLANQQSRDLRRLPRRVHATDLSRSFDSSPSRRLGPRQSESTRESLPYSATIGASEAELVRPFAIRCGRGLFGRLLLAPSVEWDWVSAPEKPSESVSVWDSGLGNHSN